MKIEMNPMSERYQNDLTSDSNVQTCSNIAQRQKKGFSFISVGGYVTPF